MQRRNRSPRGAPSAATCPAWGAGERRSLAGMGAVVLLLHLLGWGVLLLVVAPRALSVGAGGVFGVGLGATAYFLGVRHAFDADHIAAIDNTTRKLVGEGSPAVSAGYWFSLGHSSVVFGLCLLLALGMRALVGPVADAGSPLQQTLGAVGTTVAAGFLFLVGLANLAAVSGLVRTLRRTREGTLDEQQLERHLASRGFLARLLGGTLRRVGKPWHLYPVGLLMGLGFDTATQVALLVLAAGTAGLTLPWYALLVLPVLFAAGMSLFDAADGVVMARAYRWAVDVPLRRAYYGLTVTVLSVVAALTVGTVLLLQLLSERTGAATGPLALAAGADLEHAGFAIAGVLLAVWLLGAALWRWRPDRRRQGRRVPDA
ncbi:HoxN/HupN/NixA family nickel/cobalt transporter [Georgenia thermotolerans]|nr:HoxN/HupN/NixA family nickel/cobalt transporter [Georgenia thermotolerans]